MTALNGRLQVRRDTAANWTSEDPVLAEGEIGYETDTDQFKIGDGSSTWSAIADYYVAGAGGGGGASSLDDLSDATVSSAADGDILRHNGTAFVNTPGTTHYIAVGDIGSVVQAHSAVLDATTASFTTADETKLDAIEAGATGDQTGAEIKAAYEAEANTNAYTDADATTVGHITVTQAVDLDQLEADVAALANGMVYAGSWDASAGSFPSGANTGAFYTVSVAGTVDSVDFAVDDRLVAITDGASTSTYAANWTKLDATDAVTSVAGQVGNVTAAQLVTQIDAESNTNFLTDAERTKLAGIEALADVTDATNVAAAGAHMDGSTAPSDLNADVSTTQSGTAYTLVAADDAVTIVLDNAAQATVTVPTDAADDLRDGFRVLLFAAGAGGVTLDTTGLTLVGSSPNVTIAQNEGLYLEKTASADTWIVMGGTS